MTARTRGRLAAVRQRATDSRGVTLTEMIVVLAILVVILTALTQLFVSASTAEVDMSKRVQAQQDARLALDSLRREIHCAKGVTHTSTAVTITLGAYCPSNSTGLDAQITWCTVGSGARFALWRYTGNTCSGTGRKAADYLTTNAVFTAYVPPKSSSAWTASTTYTVGQYVRPTNIATSPYLFRVIVAGTSGATEPTWPATLNATVAGGATFQNVGPPEFALGRLSVRLPVDVQAADAKQQYTLKDDIVLRNTQR
jgi:prepilin-type N-terminal cleavage/methylation domain-containing protein